jgi:hypothetical protein
MAEVDKLNIKAVELALRRNPRRREKVREEPVEVEAGGTIKLIVSKEIKELFE